MAEELSEAEIRELINQQYPELTPILGLPGIWDAVSQSVQNNWTPARLQAALQATDYYRTTSASDRAWFILSSVDPATAAQRTQQYQQRYTNLISQTGIAQLDQPTVDKLVRDAAANQWSDTEFRLHILQTGGQQKPGVDGGEIATQAAQVASMAKDYGVPISDQAALDWADQLTSGAIDQNAVKGYMIQQAQSLYPGLKGALTSGQTIAQYADPYKQIAVRELNINPQDFDLSKTKWNSALSQTDPTTGNKVPLSLDQWQTKIRSDPQYGYDSTQGGKAQAASLVNFLEQKMGASA